ncbi:MAG: hypothetical protein EAX95_15665 [Candidatus Thorarchaeota archaeon]|nr:hypothetical protein [Candidatus Thorarchaeota archaeon]
MNDDINYLFAFMLQGVAFIITCLYILAVGTAVDRMRESDISGTPFQIHAKSIDSQRERTLAMIVLYVIVITMNLTAIFLRIGTVLGPPLGPLIVTYAPLVAVTILLKRKGYFKIFVEE